mmetsp:Transcript_44189/g.70995  ORF Transcript_44189/g.70995 Transcript_44189/m.70995 type:complete len:238 (+) Transcript_44189:485-1198(+)
MSLSLRRSPRPLTWRVTIFPSSSRLRGVNTTMSSRRLRNSGAKCLRTASSTFSRASGASLPVFASIPLRRCSAPRLEVMIITVLVKSTTRPWPSVNRPSSKTCNSTLKTRVCAFSTSSKRTTAYGLRRTASVSCPPVSCPTYPGGAPINRATECCSMYSDMSIRIISFSLSKSSSARVFANSVFPTPVGPRNKKEPVGRLELANPARDLNIASDTASTASSCPTTRSCKRSPNLRSL